MGNLIRTCWISAGIAAAVIGTAVTPAGACGSLVAPNGSVRLLRTTTLAAHHDGIEHYITSFKFAGPVASFGSVIPLPAEPTKVERGGDWTLQRLQREVAFTPLTTAASTASAQASRAVEVLQQVQIDSLDISILKGGGREVVAWANENGFALPGDTSDTLEAYSRRSPYFMAAKFDASKARARGLTSGDGIPIHLTMPLQQPWVPLRILATGKPDAEVVGADVFLLTDGEPDLEAGAVTRIARSEQASERLLSDLRSDKGMDWVPESMWLTHVVVDGPASDLDYDLIATPRPTRAPVWVATALALSFVALPFAALAWLMARNRRRAERAELNELTA